MKRVSVHFPHGLGDCVHFAHCLALYRRRGYDVVVHCAANKAPLFTRGAGVGLIDRADFTHPWPEPGPPEPAAPDNDETSIRQNKVGFNLGTRPMPSLGPLVPLWEELLGLCLTLDPSPEAEAQVARFLKPLHRPIICVHTQGNTSGPLKDLPPAQTEALYRGLLDRTDGALILLDWDDRVPRMPSGRVYHLGDDWGKLDVLGLHALMSRADLVIGVDSGPLHLTRLTDTPALGLWTQRHPVSFALPRQRSLHLVPRRLRDVNRYTRVEYNVVEDPHDALSGDYAADQAARLLSPPRYLPEEWIVRDVQLQQWVSWTRGGRGLFSGYVDRHRSVDQLFRHLGRLGRPPVVVETGTIRVADDWAGAGFSTYLFGALLEPLGGTLHSIDVDQRNVDFARHWTRPFGDTVQVHHDRSHAWLKAFDGRMDLFYADSMDSLLPEYQECCLAEVKLALPKLADGRSLIAVDDTTFARGKFHGKGALAVPWLLDRGWSVLYSGHQILLHRPEPAQDT